AHLGLLKGYAAGRPFGRPGRGWLSVIREENTTKPCTGHLIAGVLYSSHSRRTSSVCSPGLGGGRLTLARVALNRGAGAGCTTPSTVMNVRRACNWAFAGASRNDMTGA